MSNSGDKPLLIVFLGFPGSGKTYFSSRLAEKLHAVTLNSDALRLGMFGSHEKIEHIRATDNQRLYADVFGALDYAAVQVLRAGYSVVYDSQQTKRKNRRNIEHVARQSGAVPVLVWIKTDPAVAIKRGQEREARADSHQYSDEKMKMLIDHFTGVTELPDETENTIEINGELPFNEQFAVFKQGLAQILQKY